MAQLRHGSRAASVASSTAPIREHLNAGKPIFLNFGNVSDEPLDEKPLPEIKDSDRSSTTGSLESNEGPPTGVNKWLRILTFKLPIDAVARTILCIIFLQAYMSLYYGTDRFVSLAYDIRDERERDEAHIENIVAPAFMVAWGVFIGAVSIQGFSLMWGRNWRKSPAASLVFLTTCFLMTALFTASTFLWFYYGFVWGNSRRCTRQRTAKGSPGDADDYFLTQDRTSTINCQLKRAAFLQVAIAWACIHVVSWYCSIVLGLWGVQYRRRVLLARLLEEAAQEEGMSEKVGLVFASAPMATSSRGSSPGVMPNVARYDSSYGFRSNVYGNRGTSRFGSDSGSDSSGSPTSSRGHSPSASGIRK